MNNSQLFLSSTFFVFNASHWNTNRLGPGFNIAECNCWKFPTPTPTPTLAYPSLMANDLFCLPFDGLWLVHSSATDRRVSLECLPSKIFHFLNIRIYPKHRQSHQKSLSSRSLSASIWRLVLQMKAQPSAILSGRGQRRVTRSNC